MYMLSYESVMKPLYKYVIGLDDRTYFNIDSHTGFVSVTWKLYLKDGMLTNHEAGNMIQLQGISPVIHNWWNYIQALLSYHN